MTTIIFDLISEEELNDAIKLEEQGYPPDEAASLDKFRLRQSQAPELFLGAFQPQPHGRKLVGYICSTLSPSETLTRESMSEHVPGSSSVCIHSVCVSPEHRRQGVALSLLREYISRLKDDYTRVLLVTHEELIPLYQKAGFDLVGPSSMVHGARPWYEMRICLDAKANIVGADERNKWDLMCPRNGCRSIILKAGVAKLVQRKNVRIDPVDGSSHPALPALEADAESQWWLITPSPMEFENIGFSHGVPGPSGKRLKLLACAECDLGPLGWCEEGGTEFWLASCRVGYKTS